MKFLRYLLWPFSVLFGFGVRTRNWAYDREIKPSTRFDLPVIVIGNLSAGGTGKTPMAEYVLRLLLAQGLRPALLSRGYGRRSKGFHVVKPFSSALEVGDEPYQVKRKLPDAHVVVCEDRVEGINRLRQAYPDTNVVVLDDAYQHRRLKPGFSILLTDYNKPYFKDMLLPAGLLRESPAGRMRADVIIMTKCPVHPDAAEKERLTARLKPGPAQAVYFTCVGYSHLMMVRPDSPEEIPFPVENLRGYTVLVFTGIANPSPMLAYLNSQDIECSHLAFPDHHIFKVGDMARIKKAWDALSGLNKLILTTEKDWRRMEGTPEAQALHGLPLYFLPIEVKWEPDEKLSFDTQILNYVRSDQTVGGAHT